jgi:hypothetical protein
MMMKARFPAQGLVSVLVMIGIHYPFIVELVKFVLRAYSSGMSQK